MTLQEILDHVFSRSNKDQSGNTYNPQRFNNDLQVANIEVFAKAYGLPEEYQPGQPIPRIAFEITQLVTDDLAHLKVNMGGPETNDPGPLQINSDGVGYLPPDYVHVTSINYGLSNGCGKVRYPNIEILTDQQWSARINSPMRLKHVEKWPFCNIQNGYVRFMPKGIQFANVVYLRMPKTPVYDYYTTADDAIVYLPPGTSRVLLQGETGSQGQLPGTTVVSQSVELDWPERIQRNIANIILGYRADNLRDPYLKQSAEQSKMTGQ